MIKFLGSMEDGFSPVERRLINAKWMLVETRNGWRKWVFRKGKGIIWFNDKGQVLTEGVDDKWVLKIVAKCGYSRGKGKATKTTPVG